MKTIFFLTSTLIIPGVFLFGQINLSSSLTACYSLNGNANDLVSILNGTVNGTTLVMDRNSNPNSAYQFNGTSSDYIELPNNPLLKPTNSLSISGWIRVNNFISNDIIIFTKNNATNSFGAYALLVYQTGGAYRFRAYKESSAPATNYVESTTTITSNTWYHVVFSIDNTALKIYVNGNLENTTASTTPFDYQNDKTIILGGTNESNYNPSFNGVLDNVRFYNAVLNSLEISSLYTLDPACVEATTVSIKENNSSQIMPVLYPNPTTGKFIISTPQEQSLGYEVYNTLGDLILEGTLNTIEKNTIDLTAFANSVYLVKLKSTTLFKTVKIVKE